MPKTWIVRILLLLAMCFTTHIVNAQDENNPLGQTIEIDTRFQSFEGNPIWTLIIRDLDHDQNIPYIFDVRSGGNHWVAFTYGRNYLISASSMQLETYQSRYNKYKNYRLKNFCQIESHGRIIRGESMHIVLEGNLSPYTDSFTCNVSTYPDGNFFIYHPQ
jgi:hypothetical protein